ncbi:uncharacterized protein [Dysidea avara]|uniref:uncharacterized protein isoform X2 n=1 Tax=Dysidea avara TaxID=196820 RepID=UPI00332BA34C
MAESKKMESSPPESSSVQTVQGSVKRRRDDAEINGEGFDETVPAKKKKDSQQMFEVFTDYYDTLVNILPVHDIISELATAGIVTHCEVPKINNFDTSLDKAEYVLTKIGKALEKGINESFIALLPIIEKCGCDAAQVVGKIKQKLCIDGATTTSKQEFEKLAMGGINIAFTKLQTQMTVVFRKADYHCVRRACFTNLLNGAKLPDDLVSKMQDAKDIDAMLDILALSPYWSWIDLRLLKVMVVASNSPLATQLLENYKEAIFPIKLDKVLNDIPIKTIQEQHSQHYSRVVSKIGQNIDAMTVGDLVQYMSQLEVFMDIQGACAFDHLKNGCLEMYWYIPNTSVDRAFYSAVINRHKFHEVQLFYIQIGTHPAITDPFYTGKLSSLELPLRISFRTHVEFLDHIHNYLAINMDSEAVCHLMLSTELISDGTTLASSSNYQTNLLLLERIRKMNAQQFKSFCELLVNSASQKHLGQFLEQGLESDVRLREDSGYPKKVTHEPAMMVTEFLDMKFQLEEALLHCNPENIIEKCSSLMASSQHNIPFFPKSILSKIRKESNVVALIQMLSPYITWTDYSILSEIVKATNNKKAATILSQFECKIDYSKPLKSYPIAKPAFEMFPKQYSTHTVLAAQLQCESQHFNLHDMLDIRNFIVNKCELTPHALQLLSMAQGDSIILHWMICRSVVSLVSSNVLEKLDDFHKKGIMIIAIYPNHILPTCVGINLHPLSLIANLEEMKEHEMENAAKKAAELKHVYSKNVSLMKELKAKGDDITLFDQQLEMERQKGMELQQQIMQLELSFNANDIQKELHTLQDKDKDIKTVSNKHEQIKLHCAVMHNETTRSDDVTEMQTKNSDKTPLSSEVMPSIVLQLKEYNDMLAEIKEEMPDNPLRRLSKISWREGADAPVHNTGENAVLHDGIIYIGGGREGTGEPSYRIDRYFVADDKWNDKPISSLFCWFSMTTVNGRVVIVGGLDKQEKATNQIFQLQKQRLKKYTEMNEPRFASAVIGHQEFLIIVGGLLNKAHSSGAITLRSTEVFNSISRQRHTMNKLPQPCWGLQPAIIENKLYLLGGMSETRKPLRTVFTASLDTLSTHILNWDDPQDAVWCRSYPVVMHGKHLLLVGGYNNETENSTPKRTNEIQCFGGDTEVVGHIPFERSAPVAVNIDDSTLIVIGGKRNYEKNNAGSPTNTVWIGEVDPMH